MPENDSVQALHENKSCRPALPLLHYSLIDLYNLIIRKIYSLGGNPLTENILDSLVQELDGIHESLPSLMPLTQRLRKARRETAREAVKFYSQYADVVVLARELKLEQIENICSEIKKQNIRGPSGNLVEVEVFIHGAMCVAISGKCYMSLGQYNYSANRGACLQNCRRAYKVTDVETGDELEIDNNYVMSPKDM